MRTVRWHRQIANVQIGLRQRPDGHSWWAKYRRTFEKAWMSKKYSGKTTFLVGPFYINHMHKRTK